MKQLQIELNTQVTNCVYLFCNIILLDKCYAQLSESLTSNSVSLYEELNIRKEPLEAQARKQFISIRWNFDWIFMSYISQDCGMANDIMENQLTPYTCSKYVSVAKCV